MAGLTQRLLDHVARAYGAEARGRLIDWQGLIMSGKGLGDAEKLALVNSFFNRVAFVDDIVHWKKPDYWATPVETLATNGGDCEDFSIARYLTLREMGVPDERMLTTYVKSLKLDQAHMVLTYCSSPEAEPVVLDNLVNEIKPASERLDLQPVVRLRDRLAVHHEAFARIAGKDGAWIPAGLFVPMAERGGLSVELDRAIVMKAAERARSMGPGETLAVNISPASVHDPGFVDRLCAIIKDKPAASGRLIFETAEYGSSAKPETLRRFVEKVRDSGGSVSLDRFGAGLGQFGYLRDLLIDHIKIDGSLIRRIDADRDNPFFVQSLAQIARSLDIMVIAEPVETAQEWDTLRGLGVDCAQGFFIGAPKEAV